MQSDHTYDQLFTITIIYRKRKRHKLLYCNFVKCL